MAQTTEEVVNSYECSPDKQQMVHKLSISLAGDTPSRKHSKEDILRRHYQNLQHLEGCAKASQVKQVILPSAYSPSSVPLDDLQKISLDDLKLETHHRGCFVTGMTITPPYQFSETITIIQDESGSVASLILGFQDDSLLNSGASLPQNSTVAIKEPYVQMNEDSGYVIRVDHPSDIAVLRGDDPAVSMIMQFVAEKKEISPMEWKKEGDRAYLERKYSSAIECYTQAIDAGLKECDQTFVNDAYRKRAFANLAAESFQNAKADILSSCPEEAVDSKACFTIGRAAYELREYEESKNYFEKALQATPNDVKARKEYNRALARIGEQESGNYDFEKMIASVSDRHVRLDHADFNKTSAIGPTAYAGRGVFTTRDVQAGEIILCEKAFCLPNMYSGDGPTDSVLYNFNNGSQTRKFAQVALFQQLVQKLYKNPHLNQRLLELYAGDYERSGKEGDMVDGVPIVDSFLIEAIRIKNCFSSPRISRNLMKRAPPVQEKELTSAVWTRAAYTNHSCVPNCGRAFIGDMIVVRALHFLPAGTEVTDQYLSPDASFMYRRNMFPQSWGFDCACPLCSAEKRSPDSAHQKRRDLATKIKTEATKVPISTKLSTTTIKHIERLTKKLEDLHEPGIYATLPRLLLVHPNIWLMEAHRASKNHAKTVKYALELLRNFGFVNALEVEFQFEKGGLVNSESFGALRYAAEAFEALGKLEGKEKCMDAARRMYVVLGGCDVGRDEFLASGE
ncbi:SET protein [Venustampulla echinocandica]|uniref:SET protein n=1 Tax=Venustampulla echinocandica TaxID=2656787 RepID=A0A370TG25_9HELO|nr:SET protein [Venustampulla echinocandica]RDL33831.1 SET protein [Venustampulla echinocandica]